MVHHTRFPFIVADVLLVNCAPLRQLLPLFFLPDGDDQVHRHHFFGREVLAEAGDEILEGVVVDVRSFGLNGFSSLVVGLAAAEPRLVPDLQPNLGVTDEGMDVEGLLFAAESLRDVGVDALEDRVVWHGVEFPVVDYFEPLDVLIFVDKLDDLTGVLLELGQELPELLHFLNCQQLHVHVLGHHCHDAVRTQHLRRVIGDKFVQHLQQQEGNQPRFAQRCDGLDGCLGKIASGGYGVDEHESSGEVLVEAFHLLHGLGWREGA